MSIRKILVLLHGTQSDGATLGAGLQLAKDFKAHMVALFVRPDPSEALPYLGDGVSGQVVDELLRAAKESADAASARARKSFDEAVKAAGVTVAGGAKGTPITDFPSARYREAIGRGPEVVADQSRLSDIVVFGEARIEGEEAGGDALEAAMMSAGRPVLIAPKAHVDHIGSSVVIGWDGSPEAAHAVTSAIPFLTKAKKVTIFCVGGADNEPVPGTALADYLQLHKVSAEIQRIDPQDRAIGETLLAEAAKSGGDLLVMGGYGHSRLRELLIGGVTRHVRSHATLPVLMAH